MLTVFLATFGIFVLVIFGMSLGYIVKRKSLQGSYTLSRSPAKKSRRNCPEPCDARKKRMAKEAQRQQNRIL